MEEDEIVSAVKEIVAIDVEDGIVFEYKGIEPIREVRIVGKTFPDNETH